MDKWQAQDQFWNSFGLPAFDENTAIDKGDIDSVGYITYQAMAGVLGQTLPLSASIWYRSQYWKEISEKADEILRRIYNGVVVSINGGYFWLKVPDGTPFAQRMDSGDPDGIVKRIYLSIEAECLTDK